MSEEKNELVVFNEVKAEVAKYKGLNAELEFDYADPKGEKDARSHIFKLRGVKTKIGLVHKSAKAEALAYCREVDGVKNFLLGETEDMIAVHVKPLTAIVEAKAKIEADRVEVERIEAERVEQERIDAIARREEEAAKKEAELQAKEDAIRKAEEERQVEIKAEDDRLAREREILEAEKKAEQDAVKRADQARKDAEAKAKQDKKYAAAKAEQEKQEAIEAEKEKARQAERERVAKENAAKMEAERIAEVERKRVENKKHRKKIETEIAESLFPFLGTNSALAINIVSAIKEGTIPNLTISY